MSIKDKFSSVCEVAPNVEDKETNLKDHNPTQEKETDLDLRPEFAPVSKWQSL